MDYLIEIERAKAVTEQAMHDAKSLADSLPDGLAKIEALRLVSQLVQATVMLSIRRPAVPCRLDFVAADASGKDDTESIQKKNGISLSSSRNITITNGRVVIDGVDRTPDAKDIRIEVHGDVQSIDADVCTSISVTGSAGAITTQSGDIRCGDVRGSVKTMSGDVVCSTVAGDVKTMSGDITTTK